MSSIEAHRAFYAQMLSTTPEGRDERLYEAFATVDRARFAGPGPWRCATYRFGVLEAPADQPELLYHTSLLISLSRERGINNGEPNGHATWLSALDVKSGETVCHVGAGLGYYTAILAHLAGPDGQVEAFEVEEDLAARARANLADCGNVRLHIRSAAEPPFPACDAIYVNAGASHPLPLWLDALRPGGRLVFPMTTNTRAGLMLALTKRGDDLFDAKPVTPAGFIPCVGARDDKAAEALARALAAQPWPPNIRALHRNSPPDDSCWLAGEGWWLSTKPAA
jgi:protein-L-isoaspartate(D-aspartate) O-methyltransferase